MGFQGRDEESLRRAHPSHSTALVQASARKSAGKELSRAARTFLSARTTGNEMELAAAVKRFDELHRD